MAMSNLLSAAKAQNPKEEIDSAWVIVQNSMIEFTQESTTLLVNIKELGELDSNKINSCILKNVQLLDFLVKFQALDAIYLTALDSFKETAAEAMAVVLYEIEYYPIIKANTNLHQLMDQTVLALDKQGRAIDDYNVVCNRKNRKDLLFNLKSRNKPQANVKFD